MKLYSSGQVAALLGVHRDKVQSEIKAGAPDASMTLGSRKAFSEKDVARLCKWFVAKGVDITVPPFVSVKTSSTTV